MKKLFGLLVLVTFMLSSCKSKDDTKILIAAAASLEYSFKDELIPLFEEKYPGIKVEGSYDSSGKLQVQIEEGLNADIFMSASTKQMDSLVESKFIEEDSIIDLLENKVVLIAPTNSEIAFTGFEDIVLANSIALGDPETVPIGEYGKEILENLGLWEEVSQKASFGTNVTEVLNWVAENSADAGIVYSTDAKTTAEVKVISGATKGSLSKEVIYPVAMLSTSENKEAAKLFLEFLDSKEAKEIFEKYGFTTK